MDWAQFTWSFGEQYWYSPLLWPMISRARFAITSLAFMLTEVPAPPCIMSTGNWSWNLPSTISWQALTMASAMVRSSTPSSALASAAAIFTYAIAMMYSG